MIGQDKIGHFIVSAALAGAAGIFLGWQWGFGIAFTIGIAKEIYDKQSGTGTPEGADLLADFLGAAAGAALVALL